MYQTKFNEVVKDNKVAYEVIRFGEVVAILEQDYYGHFDLYIDPESARWLDWSADVLRELADKLDKLNSK